MNDSYQEELLLDTTIGKSRERVTFSRSQLLEWLDRIKRNQTLHSILLAARDGISHWSPIGAFEGNRPERRVFDFSEQVKNLIPSDDWRHREIIMALVFRHLIDELSASAEG